MSAVLELAKQGLYVIACFIAVVAVIATIFWLRETVIQRRRRKKSPAAFDFTHNGKTHLHDEANR